MNYGCWLFHAAPYSSDRFYDTTGALSFLVAVLQEVSAQRTLSPRTAAVVSAGVLWCLRLGSFLFDRIARDGHDRRMNKMKGNPWLFLIPFTLQAVWTMSLLTPSILAVRHGGHHATPGHGPAADRPPPAEPIGPIDYAVGAVWVFGFALEVLADRQKAAFAVAGLREKQGFISTGVWAHSRHPNYMGEIILWAATALMAYRDIQSNPQCTVASAVLAAPTLTYLLLNFVSGVPILEARAQNLWGARQDFRRYVESTPVLWGSPTALLGEMLN